ncbi:Glycoside hydrolase family 43 [Macrophomina phaseolina MS6]|uniref:Glycoside hydrolase family 43 n=1 Tax=Macrophomina phaseolina (strain MS6) TaxID=1126212 RepID=K2RF14_MACPH|nr:Glycoside hydrolase family 43 [Macrophomina phaseolina MS6]
MKGTPTAVASGSTAKQVAYDPVTTAEEGAYIFKYGSYYYLFYSKGQCCGYDTSKPASGKEYKIMVCRSSSATGGFVDKSGVSCTNGGGTVVLESHGNIYGKSAQPKATQAKKLTTLPAPVDKVFTTIPRTDRYSIIITLIPQSATRMARSSSAGTRSASRVVGR